MSNNRNGIKEQLISMGFQPNYISRALKVYEKKYGYVYSFNVAVIKKIIVKLQNKDKLLSRNTFEAAANDPVIVKNKRLTSFNNLIVRHADDVSKWNTGIVTKWIGSLQEEIAHNIQTNTLIRIIRKKKISGKHLAKASNYQQLLSLFNYQITYHTATILRKHLNAEKNAFAQKKWSKKQIEKGLWRPKVGKKIKCVDTTPKLIAKSYAATIERTEPHAILINYDGYNKLEWVEKSEWANRITIITAKNDQTKVKKIPPIRAAASFVRNDNFNYKPSQRTRYSELHGNWAILKCQDPNHGNYYYSVCDLNYLPDIRKQKTEFIVDERFLWSEQEIIGSDTIIHQQTQPMTNTTNQQMNKTWDMFGVGQRVEASDWNRDRLDWYRAIIKEVNKRNKMIKIGWLNDKWADPKWDKWFGSHEIKKRIRNPYTKLPYETNPVWKVKHIDTWTCGELQEWIHTLGLKNKYKKKVVEAISEQEISGADFNSMSEVSEVMDSFEIKQRPATKILSALDAIRSNTKHYNVKQSISISNNVTARMRNPKTSSTDISSKTFNTKHVKNWTNKDLLAWIKTIGLETKWEEIMRKPIESTGCIGRDLFAVKHFKEFAKALNIQQPMLANKVFREFKKVKQKKVNYNENDNDVSPVPSSSTVAKSKQTKIVFFWQSKRINKWSCKELQEWICSLNLSKSIERKVVKAISEQEITGEDFDSMDDMSDVVDSFEIKQISAKKIYAALLYVRMNIIENALKKLYCNQKFESGQKIKCVYMPYKWYNATIETVEENRVYVLYDGYNESEGQWIARYEWPKRIKSV